MSITACLGSAGLAEVVAAVSAGLLMLTNGGSTVLVAGGGAVLGAPFSLLLVELVLSLLALAGLAALLSLI